MHGWRMSLGMDDFSNGDDQLKIIANILQNLNAKELREARLVSKRFNEVICEHPKLFWAKNTLLIELDIQPTEQEEDPWIEVRLHKLITEYGCPNFHFKTMSLHTSKSIEFFQSSIRQQIRELKITSCAFSSEDLLRILAYSSRNLECLEINDFSDFEPNTEEHFHLESTKQTVPYLQKLSSIVLRSQSKLDMCGNNTVCIDLPSNLLKRVFNGVQNLHRISLEGWNSKTCGNLLHILRCMPEGSCENIQSLEILCIVERGLPAIEQFSFLKSLELIHLPVLKNFRVRFSHSPLAIPDLTVPFRNDLTQSVATFLERNCFNLQVLDLINCPVQNAIPNMSSFPSLYYVNTKGTFVNELYDGDVYHHEEAFPAGHYAPQTPQNSTRRMSQPLPPQNRQGNQSRNSSTRYSRIQVYQMGCILVITIVGIHVLVNWAFPSHSYLAEKIEMLILMTIVFYLTKWNEVSELWSSTYHSHED